MSSMVCPSSCSASSSGRPSARGALAPLGPVEALESSDPVKAYVGIGRSWLFGVLGRLIQMRLEEHCYPRFSAHTNNRWTTGRFSLSWGFRGLIGAVWLQMAWLLEAEGEALRRCK